MRMFLAVALLAASSATAAQFKPTLACDDGAVEVWTSPQGHGVVVFQGYGALWERDGKAVHHFTGGAGTGVPTRVAGEAGANKPVFPYFFAERAPGDVVLIWNDYVFYPECRELAPS